MIVENYLGGTHKKLKCGITDVTNDTTHAEIKNFERFNDVFGQLFRYNREDPKERLQVYLFGKPPSNNMIQQIVGAMKDAGFEVYTFVHTAVTVDIIEYETKNIVYTYSI